MESECMNGSTGHVRHDEYTEAVYKVQTSEAFAESYWCADCLIEYVEVHNMGSCVQYVGLMKPLKKKADLDKHDKVLGLGINVEQP
jgi:hypothetical protein